MRKIISSLIVIYLGLLMPAPGLTAAMSEGPSMDGHDTGIYVSEVKLGGVGEVKEYVELFNNSSQAHDLSKFVLEYAKSGFAASGCSQPAWKPLANPSSLVTVKNLNGQLEPQQFHVIEISLTDNASGSVRLSATGEEFMVVDLVGWGPAAPCYQGEPADIPPSGRSIKRSFNPEGGLAISAVANNSTDWRIDDKPIAGNDICMLDGCPEEPVVDEAETSYVDVVITELLPDPAAPAIDNQDEFIELFNAGEVAADLTGYTLHTASQKTSYKKRLTDIVIPPGEYLALRSNATGLSLVNGKIGYAWISASDGEIIDESEWYPVDIKSDQVWALADNGWHISTTATPGSANIITFPEVQPAVAKSCPTGKYRNPATGRCKNLGAVVAAIKTCKPDQERNPSTGRCRKKAKATTIVPCKPGQERNSETGRCRKIAAPKDTSCQDGYERNADTGRCRKLQLPNATRPDDPTPTNPLNLGLIFTASLVLVGYAAYEYRHDLHNLFHKLRRVGQAKDLSATMTSSTHETTTA